MNTTVEWFAYLAAESEAVRKTFAVWLRCKAKGRGALKVWQAKSACSTAASPVLASAASPPLWDASTQGVMKVAIPNAGRFSKCLSGDNLIQLNRL